MHSEQATETSQLQPRSGVPAHPRDAALSPVQGCEPPAEPSLSPASQDGGRIYGPALEILLHDLRAPLAAVRGYTRLVLQERAGPLTETQQNFLKIVLANSEQLISTVKALSQVTGAARSTFSSLLLKEILVAAAQLAQGAGGARVVISDSARTLRIAGRKDQLIGAFRTLLSGALGMAATGGPVQVDCSRDRTLGYCVKVSWFVSEPKAADRLRQVLNQRPPLENTEDEGEALTVEEIIRCHGGRVSASRNAGGMCAVLVVLPPREKAIRRVSKR